MSNAIVNLYPEDIKVGDIIEHWSQDETLQRGEIIQVDRDEIRRGYWLKVAGQFGPWGLFVSEDEEIIVEREDA
jgi:hypothetical protein